MSKVFVDTDVCIYLLSRRKPFSKTAEILFSLTDSGKVTIGVSSLSFATIDHVLRSQYSTAHSRQALAKFKTIVDVLAIDSKTTDLALASNFNDFEEAIQYYCALEHGLTTIVTRNISDYKKAAIRVVTPETFISSANL